MAIKTKISYCDSTVNPTPTCSGCELFHTDLSKNHCFAHSMSRRWGNGANKGWPQSFTEFQFFPGRIEKACGWSDLTGTKRPDKPHLDGLPRIIFLNDLGDTFSPIAPLDWSAPYIEMMAESPHIWLWLTKWPHRMVSFFRHIETPPDNFWLGTTVTSQETLWRVEQLLRLRDAAKVLWVSAEPLLEEIDLHLMSSSGYRMLSRWYGPDGFDETGSQLELEQPKVDHVIVGCETGPNARPMELDWARSLRDQCQSAGVAFFYKQGLDHSPMHESKLTWAKARLTNVLDGREWTEMPG